MNKETTARLCNRLVWSSNISPSARIILGFEQHQAMSHKSEISAHWRRRGGTLKHFQSWLCQLERFWAFLCSESRIIDNEIFNIIKWNRMIKFALFTDLVTNRFISVNGLSSKNPMVLSRCITYTHLSFFRRTDRDGRGPRGEWRGHRWHQRWCTVGNRPRIFAASMGRAQASPLLPWKKNIEVVWGSRVLGRAMNASKWNSQRETPGISLSFGLEFVFSYQTKRIT